MAEDSLLFHGVYNLKFDIGKIRRRNRGNYFSNTYSGLVIVGDWAKYFTENMDFEEGLKPSSITGMFHEIEGTGRENSGVV